jgi:hypothetical protein
MDENLTMSLDLSNPRMALRTRPLSPVRRPLGAVLIGLAEVTMGVWASVAAAQTPLVPPAPATTETSTVPRFIGVAGCLAASCHGGPSRIGGEGTAWLMRDAAHRRAYDVLFNDVSLRIAKQLQIEAAHRDARCLACHSTASSSSASDFAERFGVEYGVGCERCHGAAGDWVSQHTTRAWKTWSFAQKEAAGFRDLRSLSVRTQTCVTCHVGSPSATVDHDLIAAGHPRLAFEMSAYHALLPKHWNSSAELQADPALETRLWAIGHLAAAKALSDISTARAERARRRGEQRVAPDLAEFDCQACHHDLREPVLDRPTLRSPLGTPRWGSWSLPTARFVARELKAAAEPAANETVKSLDQLAHLWQHSKLGTTSAEELAHTAMRASANLAEWLPLVEQSSFGPPRLRELQTHALAEANDAIWPATWDGHAQRFLTLAAIYRTQSLWLGSEPTPVARMLGQYRDRLRFPVGYDTPQGFSPQATRVLLDQLRGLEPR